MSYEGRQRSRSPDRNDRDRYAPRFAPPPPRYLTPPRTHARTRARAHARVHARKTRFEREGVW